MASILRRASTHFFLRHPWQLGLALVGIAAAVAVVVSVDLVRDSAERAFARSTAAIVGKATHRLVGGPAGLDENLYVRLRTDHGMRNIAPVIEGQVRVGKDDNVETLTLLGLDAFAERDFRDYSGSGSLLNGEVGRVLMPLLSDANTVLIDNSTAVRLGVARGDELELMSGGTVTTVHILGVLGEAASGSVYSLDNLMLADIATAQELLGMTGRLSRIDVILAENDAQPTGWLREQLPVDVELLPATLRSESMKQMTRAFHSNLGALSLLALLVGMFLIYNTMTFMVMQRRPLFGCLRALGTRSGQLFRIIALEALSIGVLASAMGLLLGVGLAQGLLQVVNRTINELYFVSPDPALSLSLAVMLKAAALGVLGTLFAAIAPALEAAGVTPRQALLRSHLEHKARHLLRWASLAAPLVAGIGIVIILFSGKSIALGFTGVFIIILGFTMLTPLATVLLVQAIKPLLGACFGIAGRQASQAVIASLSRTAAAIAALMIAIATVVGIGLMVNNFRLSVDHWLQNLLRADMYVAVPAPVAAGSDYYLDRKLADAIRALPGVTGLSDVRRLQIESGKGLVNLSVFGLNDQARRGFSFRVGRAETIWPEFAQGNGVLISEPYAWHHGLDIGDTLALRSDHGYRPFRVLGIYTDYGSDQGVVSMSRRTYEAHWQDAGYSGFGIYTYPGTDLERLRKQVQALVPEQNLWLQDRRRILEASLEVFDNTFVITEILRVLAGIIAFLGVFSALMALQLERVQEHGLLRALGYLPGQVRTLIISETGLLGLVAGLLAIPLGCAITALLVIVINRRSFGWTMDLQFSHGIMIEGLLLGLFAALLAGLYPAWKMSRTKPAEALRAE